MKAYEMRGGVDPFRGKIDKGVVAGTEALHCVAERDEESEIDGQQTCPFSLEPCCEADVAERKIQRKRMCPFTLEAVGTSSMSYCPTGM